MKVLRTVVLALAALASAPAVMAADNDMKDVRSEAVRNEWQLVKNDGTRNIKTYIKQNEDGKRIHFKIDATIDGSMEKVARVHFDIDNIKRWYWETMESRLLKKVSDTEYYYYMRFNAPLNLPDRDAVFHAVIEPYSAKRGYWQITVKAAPDYLPRTPGLVRVVAQDLFARMTPLGPKQVKFETEGYVDPGGNVPAWTINFVQQRVPYLIMVSLLRMSQSKEYAEATGPAPFTIQE